MYPLASTPYEDISEAGGTLAAKRSVTTAMADAAFRATATQAMPQDVDPFRRGNLVVYPAHGVGKVDRIGTEVIAGHRMRLIQISFAESQMTLRIPAARARIAGLRKLATPEALSGVMTMLSGRARVGRLPWIKRKQMYLEKINSGDLLAVAEVARDLHVAGTDRASSYTQRNLFELAVNRLAAELAAVTGTEKADALLRIDRALCHAGPDETAALTKAPLPAICAG